jgi:lycopene cyclase domain-containing protein
MTYLAFHFVFILPPIAVFAFLVARLRRTRDLRPDALRYIGVIMAVAFVYTIPWDNYLVYRDIWSYGPDRVLAVIGYVPVEEYAFFLLQPVLTGLFYLLVRARLGHVAAPAAGRARWIGVALFLVLTAVGVALLIGGGHGLYMGLILAWASPVLAGMWWLAGDALWANRRAMAWTVAPITLWLWVADRIAIGLGIWTITDATRSGIDLVGLPVEEATFFLVTNLLVAKGLLLLSLRQTAAAPASARPSVPA